MKNTVAVIMGGGRGTRLFPLTRDRAKPAVPLFGRVRLIDVPLSNCINSGITRMFVLTQFNSASLNRHIARTYRFSTLSDDGVEVLAAEQTSAGQEGSDWFQGTADAVRKSWRHVRTSEPENILVLAGDHLYRMNYAGFVRRHQTSHADITIAVCPVDETAASSFGLVQVDEEGHITRFAEKPQGEELEAMRVDPDAPVLGGQRSGAPFLASMGIYVFTPNVLHEVLERDREANDFGREVIPAALDRYRVVAHRFQGYWEDIGTIGAFYNANMGITRARSFPLHDPDFPLFTRPRYLSPSTFEAADVTRSVITEGCLIGRARIHGSVIGIRACLGDDVEISDTLVMGSDSYETETQREAARSRGLPPMGVGSGSVVRRAILDKDVRIGRNVRIVNEAGHEDFDGPNHYVRDGIVIVPKGEVVPDGTVI